MSYFIYLRKSRKDAELEQELGDTLARHRKQLLELAKRKHLAISAIYEEVVSGETIAQRPEIQRMLADIEQGDCEGVLVMEVERLARGDTVDQGIISRTFSITGTKIITPTKTYDPENEFDQEYFEFGLFMSRREYKTILRRIQAGRIASVKDGKFIGSTAPFGYERIKIADGKGYTLKPVYPDADVIKTIFDLYLNGKDGVSYGSYKIAAYLDDKKYRTATGGSWSASSVRDILKNKTYAGYIVWGARKDAKYVNDGAIYQKRVQSDDYYCVKGLHEPIISEEWYDSAQKKMSGKKVIGTNQNKTLKNPLAGLVYCAKCGRLMSRLGTHPKNRFETLQCPNRGCTNISAPILLIEEEILNFLSEWVKRQGVSTDDTNELAGKAASLQSAIDGLEKELPVYHSQLEKAYTFLERGVYTEEIFLERSKKLNEEIRSCEENLANLKKEQERCLAELERINTFIPHVANIFNTYGNAQSAQEKNDILKEVVDRVIYLKETPNRKGHALEKNFSLEIYPKFR